VPIEEPRTRLAAEAYEGIVADEIEGGLIVIGGRDAGSAGECNHAWESDAAAQLDYTSALEALFGGVFRERERERHGAWPEIGPVGKPLVAGELFLVYKGIGC
jgi:hypothetical protein